MSERLASAAFLIAISLLGCGEREGIFEAEKEVERGWRHYLRGEMEMALISFERAASSDPSPDAYNGLGWTYLSLPKGFSADEELVGEAVKMFGKAVRLDPESSDAWAGMGLALFLRRFGEGDIEEAIKAADRAIGGKERLYGHDFDSEGDLWTFKALCYYYLGDLGRAEDALEKASSIKPESRAVREIERLIEKGGGR